MPDLSPERQRLQTCILTVKQWESYLTAARDVALANAEMNGCGEGANVRRALTVTVRQHDRPQARATSARKTRTPPRPRSGATRKRHQHKA
jgi:hypothetical protein